ncbi:MAG: hypothetical protein ACLQF0_04380 [Dissulfurispiraceae bacterium]
MNKVIIGVMGSGKTTYVTQQKDLTDDRHVLIIDMCPISKEYLSVPSKQVLIWPDLHRRSFVDTLKSLGWSLYVYILSNLKSTKAIVVDEARDMIFHYPTMFDSIWRSGKGIFVVQTLAQIPERYRKDHIEVISVSATSLGHVDTNRDTSVDEMLPLEQSQLPWGTQKKRINRTGVIRVLP